MVFEDEIDRALNSKLTWITLGDKPLSLTEMRGRLEKRYPGYTVAGFAISPRDDIAWGSVLKVKTSGFATDGTLTALYHFYEGVLLSAKLDFPFLQRRSYLTAYERNHRVQRQPVFLRLCSERTKRYKNNAKKTSAFPARELVLCRALVAGGDRSHYAGCSTMAGSERVTTAPPHGLPEILAVPPCARTTASTKASPRPCPCEFFPRTNRSNARALMSAENPGPLSSITSTADPSRALSRIVI